MSAESADTVLLIHGTFAGCDHDTLEAEKIALGEQIAKEKNPHKLQELRHKLETARVRWWQRESAFETEIHALLGKTAQCWDGPPVGDTRQTFSWSGKNSDTHRRPGLLRD